MPTVKNEACEDPAENVVFLHWIIEQVRILASDPQSQFMKDYQQWQQARAAKAAE